jgi:aspartate aminotransferase
MLSLSKRAKNIKPSATQAVKAKADALKSRGVDVISFGPGEPDFDTPEHVKEAGIEAINANFTHYTANVGISSLREAICEKLWKENNIQYEPSQIVVSTGAKQALFNSVQTVCDPGDEILLPYPCWVSYTHMVELAGGVPVYVPTCEKNGFRIDLDLLKKKITPRTKAIILNSPNNPTGSAYALNDLKGIAELALKYKFYIIADEIYEKLVYGDVKHYSPAAFSEEIKDLTITINGVSKSYAMTGWRIGYSAANKELTKAIGSIQSHSTSNTNSIAQRAAIAAIQGPQQPIKTMLEAFAQRREVIVEKLNQIPLLSCRKPEGAFYIFANISQVLGRSIAGVVINDSKVFSELLLEQAGVAVTPGAEFGPEIAAGELNNFVRISYATSMEEILKGTDRIKSFLEKAGPKGALQ